MNYFQNSNAVIVHFSKSMRWAFNDPLKKSGFLFTLIKFTKKYVKKQPKYINFDEEQVKGQLKMDDSYLSKAEKDIMDSLAEEKLKQQSGTLIESISEESIF